MQIKFVKTDVSNKWETQIPEFPEFSFSFFANGEKNKFELLEAFFKSLVFNLEKVSYEPHLAKEILLLLWEKKNSLELSISNPKFQIHKKFEIIERREY